MVSFGTRTVTRLLQPAQVLCEEPAAMNEPRDVYRGFIAVDV